MKEKILKSYLIKKILFTFIGVLSVVSIIFLSNGSYIFLRQSLLIGYSNTEIVYLVFLRLLREAPLIVSFSFIVSVYYSLNKFYKNYEGIVLHAVGIGTKEIILILKSLLIFIFLLVSISSIFLTPIITYNIDILEESAKSRPTYLNLKEKQFMTLGNENFIFYSEKVKNSAEQNIQLLENIFINRDQDGLMQTVIAEKGQKKVDSKTYDVYLELDNGKIYNSTHENLSLTNFKRNTILVHENEHKHLASDNVIKYNSIFKLIKENTSKNMSEIFYMISQPVLLILLTFFSVLIAKANPRKSKNLGMIVIVSSFVIYFNSIINVKSQIAISSLSTSTGFIVLHLFAACLIYIFYIYKVNRF